MIHLIHWSQVHSKSLRRDLEAFPWQQENVNKFKSLGGIAAVFDELRHFAAYPAPFTSDVLEYRSNLVLVLSQLIRWSPSVIYLILTFDSSSGLFSE